MSNKRAFTLLEMMVTLMLLSVIGTFVTVQSVKLVKSHRFEKETNALFTLLQEVQILAITHQTDLNFDIYLEKGHFYYQITTDEPFSESLLNQKPVSFNSVKNIFFNGRKEKKWHFEIDSRGAFGPRGTVAFFSEGETQVRYIDFQYSCIRYFNASPLQTAQSFPEFPKV